MNYWLFKSEPSCYNIDDLKRDWTEHWDGTRNYQVRNMMRDDIKKGDMVLFYHSNAGKETGVTGTAQVVRDGYSDFTAMDPGSEHPDPKHTSDKPIWYMVDIRFVSKFTHPVLLSAIKQTPSLDGNRLTQKGNRLSVFPIDKKHFDHIVQMGS